MGRYRHVVYEKWGTTWTYAQIMGEGHIPHAPVETPLTLHKAQQKFQLSEEIITAFTVAQAVVKPIAKVMGKGKIRSREGGRGLRNP